MRDENGRDSSLPFASLLNGQLVTPLLPLGPFVFLFGRSFARRYLFQQLPQLQPTALVGGQKGNTGLFSVVAHEDGDKQGQDKDCTEQVEEDEVNGVCLAVEIGRLGEDASDTLGRPHDIDPSFQRDNLKENEECTAKVVKVVPAVGNNTWSKNIPIERLGEILAGTVSKVEDVAATIVAGLHAAIEEVESVDGKGDEETERDKGGLCWVCQYECSEAGTRSHVR